MVSALASGLKMGSLAGYDDQVIAAAVAARADLIVSGDRKHLLPLGSHQGIDIVDAAEAVRRIASG